MRYRYEIVGTAKNTGVDNTLKNNGADVEILKKMQPVSDVVRETI